MWANRVAYEPTFLERLDHLFATRRLPGRHRRDGRRLDELRRLAVPRLDLDRAVHELPVRRGRRRSSTSSYPTAPHRDHRGLTGKSSGGYGAMVVPMLRPDVFGGARLALRRRAVRGLLRRLPRSRALAARRLRRLLRGLLRAAGRRRPRRLRPLRRPARGLRLRRLLLARPRARRARRCSRSRSTTGRLIDDVWAAVARLGPGPDGAGPRRRAALDEADLPRRRQAATSTTSTSGATAFAHEVEKAGATCTLELFDGAHGGLTYRYPGAIRELVIALAP